MTSEITTTEDNSPEALFRAKIAERIKADIGDLMPDDMLSRLCKDAVHSMLYRDVNPRSGQHRELPLPWVQREVDGSIKSAVRDAVQEHIEGHKVELGAVIADQVRDQFPKMVGILLVELLRGQSYGIQASIQDALRGD